MSAGQHGFSARWATTRCATGSPRARTGRAGRIGRCTSDAAQVAADDRLIESVRLGEADDLTPDGVVRLLSRWRAHLVQGT